MRSAVFFVMALLLVAIAWTLATGESMEKLDSKMIWEEITVDSPYTDWNNFPDHEGMQVGKAPHGPKHIVYVNEVGFMTEMAPYADGTVVVKENYSADEVLGAITVMVKKEGFNPEGGDWFYAKYSPEGKVQASGMVEGCMSCHAAVASRDYVFVHKFE